MSLPKTQRTASITLKQPKDHLDIVEKPVPQPAEDELLVKVKAVAVNPTDWKHIDYTMGPAGSTSGCDYAGTVVALGSGVSGFAVGDDVYGFVHGSAVRTPDNGAFAEYTAAKQLFTVKAAEKLKYAESKKLPPGRITTYEGAASTGIAIGTTLLSFHNVLGVKSLEKLSEPRTVLIWGGATSVGQIAIQVAKKILGAEVFVVASRKNEELLKSLGADRLFDYHDSDVVEQLKKVNNKLPYVLDCVGSDTTLQQINDFISTEFPVSVDSLISSGDKIQNKKPNLTIYNTLLYRASGQAIEFASGAKLPPHPESYEAVKTLLPRIIPYLNDGTIKHMPIKIYEDPGLKSADVLNEIFDLMRHDKVSAEKQVVRI